MKKCDPPRRRALALLLFTAALFLPAGVRAQTADACRQPPAYLQAVSDAETAAPDEVSTRLTAIVKSNPKLVWEDAPGCQRVLVTSWIDKRAWEIYEPKRGQAYTFDACRYTWVTAVPEVGNFCKGLGVKDDRLTQRLEQRLGLPPCSGKVGFVEFWVNPDDLFRPCADPEISDHECGPSFPRSKFVSISLDYVSWFFDQRNISYGPNGYPWTRLGYTYDWGDPKNHVGPSEFVIRPGSTVKIRDVRATADYCDVNKS